MVDDLDIAEELRELIVMCDDVRLLKTDVADAVRDAVLLPEDREMLSVAYAERYKALSGTKLPIAVARKSLAGGVSVERMVEDDAPRWCTDWVWVNTHSAYFNMERGYYMKTASFDNLYTRDVPMEGGSRQRASAYAMENGFMSVVSQPVYLPTVDDRMVTVNGVPMVNVFNHCSVPECSEADTVESDVYISFVEKHLDMICGGSDEGWVLQQWLAHQVQHMGKKMLWSPLLISIQGVGKSFIGELLRVALGAENVGVVKPSEVTSAFNGWATGKIVNVLEELKIAGHNRYEALNALKPLVTDAYLQVNEKGVSPYVTQNFCNYIAFTNYKDALPLDEVDRRWWVVECGLEKLSDLGDTNAYFDTLWEGLRKYPSQVRRWLLETDISDEFLGMKQAPMTDVKSAMISTEKTSFAGMVEVQDILQEGGFLLHEKCFCAPELWREFSARYPDYNLSNTQKNGVLKRLGYSLATWRKKTSGRNLQVWYAKNVSEEEVRKILDA